MASDGLPHLGTGMQVLKHYIEQVVRREIAQYARSNPLQVDPQGNITIPNGNSLTVTGSVVIDGNLDSGNYVGGASGYQLNGTTAEINTGLVGTGAMPLLVQTAYASATGTYGMTTAYATLATATATVPTGFTQLAADVKVSVYAVNNNTSGGSDGTGSDAIYARAIVNGGTSSGSPQPLSGNSGYTTATSFGTFALSGLVPGATVSLSVQGKSAFQSFALNANNFARVSATLIWTR